MTIETFYLPEARTVASEPASGYRHDGDNVVLVAAEPLASLFRFDYSDSSTHDSVERGLDFDARERELRAYATEHGIDLDELLDRASQHFASSEITPRTEPLSPEELEAFIRAEFPD